MFLHEKKENWASAKKTLERGYGDCDDIAIAGAYLVEPLGYPGKMLILVDNTNGSHSTTLLEEKTDKKRYGLIEHAKFIYPIYDSIENLIKRVNRSYEKISDEKIKEHRITRKNYTYYAVINLNDLGDWRQGTKNLINSKKISLKLKPIYPNKDSKDSKTKYKIGGIILN